MFCELEVGLPVLNVGRSSLISPMPEDMLKTSTTRSQECSLVTTATNLIRIWILSGTIREKNMGFTNSQISPNMCSQE